MINLKGVRIGTAYYKTRLAAVRGCGARALENGAAIVGKPSFDAKKFKLVINKKTDRYYVEYI